MTATRPQRYDQCDDTCTVDCGHCTYPICKTCVEGEDE